MTQDDATRPQTGRQRQRPTRPTSATDAAAPTIPQANARQLPTLQVTHGQRPSTVLDHRAGSGGAERVGRFRLGSELGRGGMGSVRIATDTELGRDLAIKQLLATNRVAVERFIEEAQITAQLEHPNIVPVHDLGADANGRPWLAMKRIAGRSLAAHIADWKTTRRGPLQAAELHRLLGLFGKIADAIAFAHSRGVVHRDLKPHNVMVGEWGEVLVVDWGLARPLANDRHDDRHDHEQAPRVITSRRGEDSHDLTVDGAVFGSPGWMPPEQAAGDVAAIDERSDIFALGAILYHMLTLHAPYEAKSARDALVLAARGDFRRPRDVASAARIPRELEAIVLRAMAYEPADRYQTVGEFEADLAAWRALRPTTAWRAGPIDRLTRSMRRHPTTTLAVTLVLIATGLVAALLSLLYAAERDRAAEATRAAQAAQVADAERAQRERAEADRRTRDMLAGFRRRVREGADRGLREFDVHWGMSRETLESFIGAHDQYLASLARDGSPPDIEALRGRAMLRVAIGDYTGALADASAIIGIEPTAPHFSRRGNIYMGLGRLDDASADLDRALQLDPECIDALALRGAVNLRRNRLQQAIDDCTAAIGLDPRFAYALDTRGAAQLSLAQQLGNTPGVDRLVRLALADFDAAVVRAPCASYLMNRANAHLAVQDWEAAARDCELAAPMRPDSAGPWLTRARALQKTGDMAAALRSVDRGLAIEPDDGESHDVRGRILERMERFADSLAAFDRAIDLGYRTAATYHARGVVRHRNGNNAGALADFDTSLALQKTAYCYCSRAQLKFNMDDARGAVADFDAALRLSPDDIRALSDRGKAHEQLREFDAAAADYSRALTLQPHHVLAASLGYVLHELDRDADAIAAFRRAWQLTDDRDSRTLYAENIRRLGGEPPR
ncbi:MAG: tetratricopeptide repeat protein [Planctomycetota bacterium]